MLVILRLALAGALLVTGIGLVPIRQGGDRVYAQSASLSAPAEVGAGAEFQVSWTGPNQSFDYIGIFTAGSTANSVSFFTKYTSLGNPARMRAPDQSGNYEIRYVTGTGASTLASAPVKVLPASATVDAPTRVTTTQNFDVSWTGPNNQFDYIGIFAAGSTTNAGSLWTVYTRLGNPAKMRAPTTPGTYDVRYVSGQAALTWASDTLIVCSRTDTECGLAVITASALGFLEDRVGRGERLTADTVKDATFSLNVQRSGAHRITSITLWADPTRGYHRWDTQGSNVAGALGVANAVGAPLLNGTNTSVDIAFTDLQTLRLYAADDGIIRSGGAFNVQVCLDGSTSDCAIASLDVAAAPAAEKTAAPYKAPFRAPSTFGNTSFHVTSNGPQLGVYQARGGTIEADVLIGRYLGETDADGRLTDATRQKLVSNRIARSSARLSLAVWATWPTGTSSTSVRAAWRFGEPPGDTVPVPTEQPEAQRTVGRVMLNGCSAGNVSALNNSWNNWQVTVPIECLRFPVQPGTATIPPVAKANRLQVVVDSSSAATSETWSVQVDWAAIGVEAVWPIAFLHGKGDGGFSWSKEDASANNPALDLWDAIPAGPGSGSFKSHFDALGFLSEPSVIERTVDRVTFRVPLSNGPQDSTMTNARRLKTMLGQVKTAYGVERVNIVAHSKGGLDSRGYISRVSGGTTPDVANLVTLSTPHWGSTVATLPYVFAYIVSLTPLGLLGGLGVLAATWNDLNGAQWDLMPPVTALFNLQTPNRGGVKYYTIGANGGSAWRNIPNPNWATMPADKRGDAVYGFGSDPRVAYTAGMSAGKVGWFIIGVVDKNLFTFPPILFMPSDDLVSIESAKLPGATHLGVFSKNHFTIYQDADVAQRVIDTIKLSASGVSAQEVRALADVTVPQPAVGDGALELASGSLASGQGVSLPVPIDSAGPALFSAMSSSAGLQVELVDPAGARITPTALPDGVDFVPLEGAEGSGGDFMLDSAAAGAWTMELMNTSAASLSYAANSYTPSSLTLRFATTGAVHRVGASTQITATLQDGATAMTGATVEAIVSPPSSITATIALRDDGVSPDAAAGDGTYSGGFVPTVAGQHGLAVATTGTRNASPFRRVGSSALVVLGTADRITGAISENGRDDDGDTLFDALDVAVGVTASGGTYELTGSLATADGKIVATAVTTATLAAGASNVTLSFPGRDIFEAGRDGPYTLRNLTLSETGGYQLLDLLADGPATGAYQYVRFDHDGAALTGLVTSRGLDTGGDTRFEALEVKVEVDVQLAGTYQWNAQLVGEDGYEYGLASGIAALAAGRQMLTLYFPGSLIAARGRDGRFLVRNLTMWREEGNAELTVLDAGATESYTAAAFMYRGLVYLPAVPKAMATGW